jgi:hypothetical protein
MYYTGARTLVYEPLRYCAPKDFIFATIRNRIVAENSWRQVEKTSPPGQFSHDYADGFKCGYSDYLCYGGSGEPPPLPPRRYWRKYHQTPEGHQAILEWFAGFRHGASLAQESGQRELVTVPTSVFQPVGPPLSTPDEVIVPEQYPTPPPEMLPAPPAAALPEAPLPERSSRKRLVEAEPEPRRTRGMPPQYEDLGSQVSLRHSAEAGSQPPVSKSYFGVLQSSEPGLDRH